HRPRVPQPHTGHADEHDRDEPGELATRERRQTIPDGLSRQLPSAPMPAARGERLRSNETGARLAPRRSEVCELDHIPDGFIDKDHGARREPDLRWRPGSRRPRWFATCGRLLGALVLRVRLVETGLPEGLGL